MPLFLVVSVGYIYARQSPISMEIPNKLVMDVFTPLLIFHVLSNQQIQLSQYLSLAAGGLFIILGSGIIGYVCVKWVDMKWRCFVPTNMFCNCGNLGLPLAVYAFGEQALFPMTVLFVTSNALHFSIGIRIQSGYGKLKGMVTQPFIIAAAAGMIVNLLAISIPLYIERAIELMAQVAIPMMLFSLGAKLTQIGLQDWKIGLWGGFLGPTCSLLLAAMFLAIVDLPPLQTNVLVVFAALPAAVINYIVAEKYNCDAQKVAAIILFGHLCALLFLPMALYISFIR